MSPAEVESILLRQDGVAQVAVVGVSDDRLGEVGAAFVVATSGSTIDPKELISWCRANMANYKVPRYVRVVEKLPTNPSGKIVKSDLRDRAKALFITSDEDLSD